jgi:hypothetical protein
MTLKARFLQSGITKLNTGPAFPVQGLLSDKQDFRVQGLPSDDQDLVYRQESNLAISSSPVTNNNVQFIVGRTAIVRKIKKFLAVCRVSA